MLQQGMNDSCDILENLFDDQGHPRLAPPNRAMGKFRYIACPEKLNQQNSNHNATVRPKST